MNNLKKSFYTLLATASSLAIPHSLLAQESAKELAKSDGPGFVFWFILGVCFFLVFVAVYMLFTLQKFINVSSGRTSESVVETLSKKLVNAVPTEQEEKILFHHEYDGIRELDNSLPPWWIMMFYATIVFAIVYMGYYHVFAKGDLQIGEYNNEIKVAAAAKEEYLKYAEASLDENSVTLITDKAKMVEGKAIFSQYCAACHGKDGEGGVGPNLTDEYWLHGGGIKDVFKTVKYGVPQKGMIAWEKQLKPGDIQQVSSFLISLKGSNPANAKAPQGDLYKEK